jgi:dephospho-CoA kinase
MTSKLRIGLVGKMGSGKSTIAKYIAENIDNCYITSFAKKLKEIVNILFDYTEKNRDLLIKVGMSMRAIDKNIWINHLLTDIDNNLDKHIIIDDVRFVNELTTLRNNGWVIIKLDISREEQITRLKSTYPNTYQTHLQYIDDETEINIKDSMCDYIIVSDKDIYVTIDNILQNLIL